MLSFAILLMISLSDDLPPVFVADPPPLFPLPPALSPRPKLAHRSWPADVPGDGFKLYAPTNVSQYIVIRNGSPFHQWHHINERDPSVNSSHPQNPNSKSPWRVSGGMEGLRDWKSIKLTNVDKKDVAVHRQNIPIAGAGQSLPGFTWQYKDGASFADLLVNRKDEPFELRVRTKVNGKWRSVVAFEDAEKAPNGYVAAGKCATCHDKAGDSQQYGIMIRGSDTVFSFNPMQ